MEMRMTDGLASCWARVKPKVHAIECESRSQLLVDLHS
jgi:hypothetical protein